MDQNRNQVRVYFIDGFIDVSDAQKLKDNSQVFKFLLDQNSTNKSIFIPLQFCRPLEIAIHLGETDPDNIPEDIHEISEIFQILYFAEKLEFTKLIQTIIIYSSHKYQPGELLQEFVHEINTNLLTESIFNLIASNFPVFLTKTSFKYIRPDIIARVISNNFFTEPYNHSLTDDFIDKVIEIAQSNSELAPTEPHSDLSMYQSPEDLKQILNFVRNKKTQKKESENVKSQKPEEKNTLSRSPSSHIKELTSHDSENKQKIEEYHKRFVEYKERTLPQMQKDIDLLEKQLKEQKDENEKLKKELKSCQDEENKLITNHETPEELQNQIKELSGKNTSLKTDLDQILNIDNEVKTLEKEVSELKENVEKNSALLGDAQQHSQEITDFLSKNPTMEQLQNERARLFTEIEKLIQEKELDKLLGLDDQNLESFSDQEKQQIEQMKAIVQAYSSNPSTHA